MQLLRLSGTPLVVVTPVPSFEELADEYSGALFTYLARMTGNQAEADDLLQETLMRIARALPGFEQRSSVKTWVYRIATNVAIDALRKRGRYPETELDEIEVADMACSPPALKSPWTPRSSGAPCRAPRARPAGAASASS